MTIIQRAARRASAFIAILVVLAGLVSTPAWAQPMVPAGSARTALLGTWVGTYEGYHDGAFEAGQQRFVITTMRGSHAKGTWQYRKNASGAWSAKEPLQWVVLPGAHGDGWNITGADANGIYIGHLDEGSTSLVMSYQGSTNDLISYRFAVRRR